MHSDNTASSQCSRCGERVHFADYCPRCEPGEYEWSNVERRSQITAVTTPPSTYLQSEDFFNEFVDFGSADEEDAPSPRADLGVLQHRQPVPEHYLSDMAMPLRHAEWTNAAVHYRQAASNLQPTRMAMPNPSDVPNILANGNSLLQPPGSRYLMALGGNPELQNAKPQRSDVASTERLESSKVQRKLSGSSRRSKPPKKPSPRPRKNVLLRTSDEIDDGNRDSPFNCCGRHHIDQARFNRHKRWHDKLQQSKPATSSEREDRWCEQCQELFLKKDDYKRHLKAELHADTAKDYFICPEPGCAAKIKNSHKDGFNVKRHLKNKHKLVGPKAKELIARHTVTIKPAQL